MKERSDPLHRFVAEPVRRRRIASWLLTDRFMTGAVLIDQFVAVGIPHSEFPIPHFFAIPNQQSAIVNPQLARSFPNTGAASLRGSMVHFMR